MIKALATKRNALLLALYATFVFWYSHLGGPITASEQAAYIKALTDQGISEEQKAHLATFMASDDGNDFVIVNLIHLNPSPETLPATGPDAPASALINHYMEHMLVAQLVRASHPLFVAQGAGPTIDLLGVNDAETWTQAALFRYRSRRDLMEIISDPQFHTRHEYKLAAMLQTIAVPVTPSLQMSDPRLLLALLFLAFSNRRRQD